MTWLACLLCVFWLVRDGLCWATAVCCQCVHEASHTRRRFLIDVSLIQAPLVSPTLFVPPSPIHKDGVDRIHFLNVCRLYVHLIESEVLARMPLGDVTRAECGGCARRTGGEGCVPAPLRRTGAGIDGFVELCFVLRVFLVRLGLAFLLACLLTGIEEASFSMSVHPFECDVG